MAREIPQSPCMTVLGFTLNKGGKKDAKLHPVHLLAAPCFGTADNQELRPAHCSGGWRWYDHVDGVSTARPAGLPVRCGTHTQAGAARFLCLPPLVSST